MITDKDVKKLKEVFATKDELRDSVGALAEDIKTVIEMVGDVSQQLKETNQKLDKKTVDHDDILENHERRLDKVEDKVFATT